MGRRYLRAVTLLLARTAITVGASELRRQDIMFPLNVHSFLLTVLCALLVEKGLAIPAPAHFYPYGPDNDDSMVPPGERRSKMFVSRDFPYRGEQADYVKVRI